MQEMVYGPYNTCVDPDCFTRGGPILTTLFIFLDDRREDPNTTISGPSSACQQNTIEMAFRWLADNGPLLNTGFLAL